MAGLLVGQREDMQMFPLGAGGAITGLSIAVDGTKVIRTDTYGSYIDNGGWKQLLSMTSMPTEDVGVDSWSTASAGTYEIRVASSNSQIIYKLYNGYVFRSINGGKKWVRTTRPQDTSADPNDLQYRGMGPKMSVDPNNPNVVWITSPTRGVDFTTDGGSTWKLIPTATIAAATSPQGYLVCHDPSSSFSNGRTQRILVSSYGTGVYESTDGGATFSLTPSTPTTHTFMTIDAAGITWFIDGGGTGNLKKFSGPAGSWSTPTTGMANNTTRSVAVDPANGTHIFVVDDAGKLCISTNTGSTWVGPTAITSTSADIGWLSWYANAQGGGSTTYLSTVTMAFAPAAVEANALYLATGLGIFKCNPPTTNTTVTWASYSAGIEQLNVNQIIAPPNGTPLAAVWDQGVFLLSSLTTPPSTHSTPRTIAAAWSIDYTKQTPGTIVALITNFGPTDLSGKSTDGGQNWTQFAASPVTAGLPYPGGSIAAATANSIVVANSDTMKYTLNGGTSWLDPTFAGASKPTAGANGWGQNYYTWRQILIADEVNIGTYYAFFDGTGVSGARGIWKSTDSAANWSLYDSSAALSQGNAYCQMRAVPSRAGEFFFTEGRRFLPHPNSTSLFYKITDNGSALTLTALPNVKEVHCFGFGKAKPGSVYPVAVYIFGWVNDVIGIWRSDDCDQASPTWTRVNDGYPVRIFDQWATLSGDMTVFKRFLIAGHQGGMAYFPG